MDLTELARRYYRAFEDHDRSFIENNLAPGFTFTSPFDDHIGREEYFRRCWPTAHLHRKFAFVTVMQEGDKVFVAYDAEMHVPNATHPAAQFRNAELLTFENGKLKSVEVFFGDPPRGLTRREFAVESGAG
jgi:ketosteroid isomerase-like protein